MLERVNSKEQIIWSLDFAEIDKMQKQGQPHEVGLYFQQKAQKLKEARSSILL